MLTLKGGMWVINPYKIRYKDGDEAIERWAHPSKEWWVEFTEMWGLEDVEFIELEATPDMLERTKQIAYMPDGYFDDYVEYVLSGSIPYDIPDRHPLFPIKLEQEKRILSNYILELDMRLTMKELGL